MGAAAWPEVVCRPRRYLEVVVAGHLPVAVLAEVRLDQRLSDRLDELEARTLAGEALDPDESNEVLAYGLMQRWRRSHGTAITAVA